MKCPACESTQIIKNGRSRDRQRYRCKSCGYRFVEFPQKNYQKPSKINAKGNSKSSKNPKAIDRSRIEALTEECLRLRQELQAQSDRLKLDHQQNTFRVLQSLLTQYKSVQHMICLNPNLPAQNLIALFTSLDRLMQNWEYVTIGEPWQQVPYDPQFHQADRADLSIGEPVYIRFVGYQVGGDDAPQILVPAKVSRTLPAIAQPRNPEIST
jgi:hypothetical protein